jgi:tRNA-binding protein
MAETFEQYTARMLACAGDGDPRLVLQHTAGRIGALIATRTDAELRWTPSPDRWSIAQILAHLADAEVVSAYRVRMILAASGTPIQAFDQNAWARELDSENRDAFASLALFKALRTSLLALLENADEQTLERFGMHAERGKETIRHLLRLYAGHDVNHLQQIERLLADQEGDRQRPQSFVPHAIKPLATIESLQQLDIRVGTVAAVAAVKGTDRLAALTVDFGDRSRTIVAGIRTERTGLDALVGQQALFVLNLPPRTIRGQVSEGMLFDLGYEDGIRPALAQPEWPVPDGTRAG